MSPEQSTPIARAMFSRAGNVAPLPVITSREAILIGASFLLMMRHWHFMILEIV